MSARVPQQPASSRLRRAGMVSSQLPPGQMFPPTSWIHESFLRLPRFQVSEGHFPAEFSTHTTLSAHCYLSTPALQTLESTGPRLAAENRMDTDVPSS